MLSTIFDIAVAGCIVVTAVGIAAVLAGFFFGVMIAVIDFLTGG